MTTIEDKIRLFSKIIYDKIKADKQAEFDSFEREREQKLEELKKHLEENTQEEIKEASKKAKLKAVEKISKEKIKFQQMQMSLREDMQKQINQAVEKRILEYVETAEYENLSLKLLEDVIDKLGEDNYILYLTRKDGERLREKIISLCCGKGVAIVIREAENDILGGFLLEDSDRKYRIDNSLSNKLLQLRDFIGLSINESLR
ncbi:V-type ATP synthase subunit E [Clostridium thermarum]|uniref:V-type ATP synthase subunit E n=1 Tax=Clostridium thermarum TaxID=1716543 RepID=UPI0013D6348D|nr:V-type ATP synthase subunit E [Clostridium thermarum]